MTAQSKKKLSKVSAWLGAGAFTVSVLLFWLGIDFLKTEVFPHYYNAGKHVIVQQNPDTKEIYAWRDEIGRVFTQEDSQVKNFTWGITVLLLFVMAVCAASYNVSIKYYTKVLLESEYRVREGYMPELQ